MVIKERTLFSECSLAEYGHTLAQDYGFGAELANSLPRRQKGYAENQDLGAQDQIGNVIRDVQLHLKAG